MLKIHFTATAWKKQMALIRHFNTEVAWHGLVRPITNGYEIYDILVYPQEVTGGTVETDQVKYQNWLMSQPDEIFNHIRYQAHSHVYMDTFPSATDLNNQKRMNVPNDDFYIFFIWNKNWWYTADIYDHGVFYNESQIDLTFDEEDEESEFIKEAESLLTVAAPKYPATWIGTSKGLIREESYWNKFLGGGKKKGFAKKKKWTGVK